MGMLAAAWTKRIEQRWFVGAHSNVGGGYPSNPLAQQPLAWLLEGARDAGLICDPFPRSPAPDKRLGPRDSFSEFAKPYWASVLRAKRSYRVLDPNPEVRADRSPRGDCAQSGFMLVNINEQVDPSVIDYWTRQSDVDPPPNLVEYARRKKGRGKDLTALAQKTPVHPWMGDRLRPYIVLALWATLAAGGILAVDRVFGVWMDSLPPAWLVAVAAALFALIDWAESCQSFNLSLVGPSPIRRAFVDSIYWTRSLSVALFVFGAIGLLILLVLNGISAVSPGDVWQRTTEQVRYWATVAFGGGLGVGLGVVFNHLHSKSALPRAAVVIQASLLTPVLTGVLVAGLVLGSYEVWRIIAPALGVVSSAPIASAVAARFGGLLLLLQLAQIYFVNALSWAGEPMIRARIGSILPLQLCARPAGITKCLDGWCAMMRGHAASRCAMSAAVRESLYRDIIGFIPVYSAVFMFGLSFGYTQLGWMWLQTVWFALPLTTLVADYTEDLVHLRCLRLHEKNQSPSSRLALFGAAMTFVKMLGFLAGGALTMIITAAATLRIYAAPEMYGWRGLIALAITTTGGIIVGGLSLWSFLYRFATKAVRSRSGAVSPDSHSISLQESAGEATR
jgi:hypothetical protein